MIHLKPWYWKNVTIICQNSTEHGVSNACINLKRLWQLFGEYNIHRDKDCIELWYVFINFITNINNSEKHISMTLMEYFLYLYAHHLFKCRSSLSKLSQHYSRFSNTIAGISLLAQIIRGRAIRILPRVANFELHSSYVTGYCLAS